MMDTVLEQQEKTLFELEQCRRNISALSENIDVVANGNGEIIDTYFDMKSKIHTLIGMLRLEAKVSEARERLQNEEFALSLAMEDDE
jgi:hypothetical protein